VSGLITLSTDAVFAMPGIYAKANEAMVASNKVMAVLPIRGLDEGEIGKLLRIRRMIGLILITGTAWQTIFCQVSVRSPVDITTAVDTVSLLKIAPNIS
jgi:hypothetical protein